MPFDFKNFGSGDTTAPKADASIPAEKKGVFDFAEFGKGDTVTPKKDDKKPGFVQSIVRGVASPVLKTLASGEALYQSGKGLAKAIAGKDVSKEEAEVKRLNTEGADFGGYLGNAKPIGAGFDATKGVKENLRPLADAAGTGLEFASYAVGGGGAKEVLKQGIKGAIKQGLKTGAVVGAESGGLAGLGEGLQDPNATVGSVAKKTALGTVLGGATGAGVGAIGPLAGKVATKAGEVVERLSPEGRAKATSQKMDDLVGMIVQGKKGDIPKAKQALSSIDPEGIKTFDDLTQRADEHIETVKNKLDEVLSTDTTLRKLKDLNMETRVGDQVVKHNYVSDAIEQLKELYSKTNDPVSLAKIKQLEARAKQSGLTIKEVNDLAREHGSEFGQKAFSKTTGEPLTSVNAQSFENTRTGLKGTARDRFGNKLFNAADDEISKLINLKSLSKDMSESVNKLQQKIKNRSVLQKLGGLIGKGADMASGGTLKGFVSYFLPRGEGLKVLNALDLEKALAKNVAKFKALAEQDLPEQTIIEKLDELFNLRTAPTIDLKNPSKSKLPKMPVNLKR